jgi:hypothetical protein
MKPDAQNVLPVPVDESRRNKVIRELKLALVDQQQISVDGGFNPYDALQGRVRVERWEKRRR